MSQKPQQPTTKKDPYTGDPNATMTMCYKKLRRHTSNDLDYALAPNQSEPGSDTPKTVNVQVICKHCKQHPFLSIEPEVRVV